MVVCVGGFFCKGNYFFILGDNNFFHNHITLKGNGSKSFRKMVEISDTCNKNIKQLFCNWKKNNQINIYMYLNTHSVSTQNIEFM